jgi:hypothetical protein
MTALDARKRILLVGQYRLSPGLTMWELQAGVFRN